MCHMSGITGAVFASWGMCFPAPLSLNSSNSQTLGCKELNVEINGLRNK